MSARRLLAGGSDAGQALAARTADVVFSVVQDIEEAKAGYASLKKRLPAFGRKAEDVTVLPGVMPIVGRTDKEAFEKLNRKLCILTGGQRKWLGDMRLPKGRYLADAGRVGAGAGAGHGRALAGE